MKRRMGWAPGAPSHTMSHQACHRTDERIAEVLDDSLVDAELTMLREHLGACDPCNRLVAGHRRLERHLVDALTATPRFEVPVPALPGRTPVFSLRAFVLRNRAAAMLLAAVLLVAGGGLAATGPARRLTPPGPAGTPVVDTCAATAPGVVIGGEPVVIHRVVDGRIRPGAPDEFLVALTTGWEAVAARRPTELR